MGALQPRAYSFPQGYNEEMIYHHPMCLSYPCIQPVTVLNFESVQLFFNHFVFIAFQARENLVTNLSLSNLKSYF